MGEAQFAPLWENEIGSRAVHKSLTTLILEIRNAVRHAYEPFGIATDTLVTKVLLGTVGCLPALDRYFIAGFRLAGFEYSVLNDRFVDRILKFCFDNAEVLYAEQARIQVSTGVRYPLMKLADMAFFQNGYDATVPVPLQPG